MTAPHIVDPAGLLSQALSDASPDLMRELLGDHDQRPAFGGRLGVGQPRNALSESVAPLMLANSASRSRTVSLDLVSASAS